MKLGYKNEARKCKKIKNEEIVSTGFVENRGILILCSIWKASRWARSSHRRLACFGTGTAG